MGCGVYARIHGRAVKENIKPFMEKQDKRLRIN